MHFQNKALQIVWDQNDTFPCVCFVLGLDEFSSGSSDWKISLYGVFVGMPKPRLFTMDKLILQ